MGYPPGSIKPFVFVDIPVYPLRLVSATRSSPRAVALYRFGPYEADVSRSELRKFGIPVRLERKPWLLLLALLDRAGEIATRLELQRLLWGDDVFVDFEAGLNVAIKKVRAALNDSADQPEYVETVAREGYRFVATVEQVFAAVSYPRTTSSAEHPLPILFPPMPGPIEAKPTLPADCVRQSWLSEHKALFAALGLICIALVVLMGARLTQQRLRQPELAHAGKIMLVVLPFENLSNDPNQEYFSDGMTEELSEQLGNQDPQRLGVIGRTSAMTYKHSHRTIGEIGKDLAVDYVLEGSVRRDGNEVRVTAQLVQVSDQTHVWAANYDENVRGLLQMESELAGEIARQVGVSIVVAQVTKPTHPHIPSPEAHEAYLLGRYNWYKRTRAGWKDGKNYFRRAIREDPEYAAAYAALAECRIPKDEARAAALKAIALDPNSGEAYTALAWVQLYWYLEPSAAEPAFKRAIELAPNYAEAHHSYGNYLGFIGHTDEAINEEKQAMLLDPLSPLFQATMAEGLAQAGDFDNALKQLSAVFKIDPQFAGAHGGLGRIYTRQGKYKDAIEEFQTEARLGRDLDLSSIGYVYALWGKKKEAVKALSKLQESGGAPAALAAVEIGLGHKEKALNLLEKVYEDHDDDALLDLKVDPMFDPLRSDPKFQGILRRMNFPQ
jgi:TolB-like protein/DNA-binding winged helix-turn-helix (wHTH) protein/thioredoxin-like negative regulator of GroEL